MDMGAGRLYVVATPIGNLEDISVRALRVLREVDLIAAEDTRHSHRLLDHYEITTPLTSYHDHNEARKTDVLLDELRNGRDIALISDAGTPCVSDPGYRIVRAAHEGGFPVIPIPGPSALVTALSVSGLPNDHVTFHGFFPRKDGQARALLDAWAAAEGTHVFFESPGRIAKTLALIAERWPESPTCLAREMTKTFEELRVATARQLSEELGAKTARGEYVVAIHVPPAGPSPEEVTPEKVRACIERLMEEEGLSRRDAIRRAAAEMHLPRNYVYAAGRADQS
jgi:16S rRNA (cytidine1402-2'-O)-methyltransferase